MAALSASGVEPAWRSVYGALGCLATKDVAECRKNLLADAEDQLEKEPKATSFLVLGGATPTTEGYAKPSDELLLSKVFWCAAFESKEAYNSDDHMKRPMRADKFGAIMKTMLNNDPMKDMVGGYLGPLWYIEKASEPGASLYSILVTARAKDAASALELVEVNKAHALKQLAAERGALRYVIIPPGGDMPGGDSEDAKCTVRGRETSGRRQRV